MIEVHRLTCFAAVLMLGIVFLLAPGRTTGSAVGAPFQKVTCHTVTKTLPPRKVRKKVHGRWVTVTIHPKKKVKVCYVVATLKPTRTPMPTATPKPTPVPITLTVSPHPCDQACAALGVSVGYETGVATLTDPPAGASVQLSHFGVGQNSDGSYYLYAYDSEQMTTPTDIQYTSLPSSAGNFGVRASNGHPYLVGNIDSGGGACPESVGPSMVYKTLYPGETNAGWICSESLDPQDLGLTFTVQYYNDQNINAAQLVPVVDLRIVVPHS